MEPWEEELEYGIHAAHENNTQPIFRNQYIFMSLVATNHIFDLGFRIFPYDSKQCYCPFGHYMNMHTAFL